jgi:glycine dehydrogenase
MLSFLGVETQEQLASAVVPEAIRLRRDLCLPQPLSETDALSELRVIASRNQVFRSLLGMGYSDCITPAVIQRNILENPGWYTQYTPYQAEIAQGRLESLLNFQTMIIDLTGLPIANASLLDEATAAAEAMHMCLALYSDSTGSDARTFFVDESCHPQVIEVVKTRANPLGITVSVGSWQTFRFEGANCVGVLVQYPTTDGRVEDYRSFFDRAHAAGAKTVVSADLLALCLLKPPGEFGADIALGTAQRFGVPLGFGGPHAAYFATRDEYKRQIPGRIVGVSQDSEGRPAIRLALQTREQHIRRDKATSNICTAQALLANISAMYAVYHGPEGLRDIALRVHGLAEVFRWGVRELGQEVHSDTVFDTIRLDLASEQADRWIAAAEAARFNLRRLNPRSVCVAFDEVSTLEEVGEILGALARALGLDSSKVAAKKLQDQADHIDLSVSAAHQRQTAYLQHEVFNKYHSETELLRYMRRLEGRDISLTHSMIPLGSCTMKLNATSEMFPVTWPEFGKLHPFAPAHQAQGYGELFRQLQDWLSEITGFAAVSLQPNSGAQGEYAGLLAIRAYHRSRNEGHRNICLIPKSAHGTNPASATMAGMRVVVVECDSEGNVDLVDLETKAREHAKDLSSLMVTYPSTHGVFETQIRRICEIVHSFGGQVYMDGANMNAQVGLCRPGDFGPDVCHLNLHKTFCIPHGGGGPGMGPIGVAKHLVPFLPRHPLEAAKAGAESVGPVSAAPWGSASILPISWMYIRMMGSEGLRSATEVAILNANYIAKRLKPHYPVLYSGESGWVAHECIFDIRPIKAATGIDVEDIAKRLMDYGFHAPTVSFPVAGTLMVEPTESESKAELDRFCDAMISIRKEIAEIESGKLSRDNNPLKNAPHTSEQVSRSEWARPYTREMAAFPLGWVRERKFWPAVGRINNVLGDRNLVCACLPIEDYRN